MDDETDLICAFVLDGKGGATPLRWPGIEDWRPEQGVLWIHLDRTGERARRWLLDKSGVDPVTARALLEEDVRPRVVAGEHGLFVALRGANLNPGAEASDMVALRIFATENRVITLRHRRLMAVQDLREAIGRGQGPTDAGSLLAAVAGGMADRLAPVIETIDERIDALEEQVLTAQSAALRGRLAEVRREAIALRRYLSPQRDVLGRLATETTGWLSTLHRAQLRETADRTTRYVEDLDAGRERAQVVQDELNNRLADQTNRTIYLLTVISAVLLPPSLLTGLLGINVGGLPGVDSPWAFAAVVGLIVLVAAVELVLLRRLKWI